MPPRPLPFRSFLLFLLALSWIAPRPFAEEAQADPGATWALDAPGSLRPASTNYEPNETAVGFVYTGGGYKREHLKWSAYLISWPGLKGLKAGDELTSLPAQACSLENGDIVLGDGDDIEINNLYFGPNNDPARVPSGIAPRGVRLKATVSPGAVDRRVKVEVRIDCGGSYKRATATLGTTGTLTIATPVLEGVFTLEEVRQARGRIAGETDVLPFEPLQGIIDRLNFSLETIEMTVLHDPSDLTVEEIRPREPLIAGEDASIDFDARNQGGSASDPAEYAIWVDDLLACVRPFPALGPGELVTMESVNIGVLSEGQHSVRVVLDPNDSVPETDEENNEREIDVTVYRPTPQPSRASREWMFYE